MRRRRESAQTGAAYQKLALARAMRRQPTRCEALLWIELRRQRMVFRFRRQHIIAGYIVDFCCPAARLAIEVDGSSHVDRADEDRERDVALAQLGVEVMRISNDRVASNIEAVPREILDCSITRTRCASMATTQSSSDRPR